MRLDKISKLKLNLMADKVVLGLARPCDMLELLEEIANKKRVHLAEVIYGLLGKRGVMEWIKEMKAAGFTDI